MVVTLASCSGEEDIRQEEVQVPINFASIADETEAVTRANTTLGRNFVVYGYKNAGGTEQTVFDGYQVHYLANSAGTSEDNTHNYYYVGIDNQTLKYWDFSASEYHFWGLWQSEGRSLKATFTGEKHNVLTIPNVTLRVGDPSLEDDVLFSRLCERKPVTKDVVSLSFCRPYSKLRIMFYTSEPVETDKDKFTLSQITFGPDPSATSPYINKVYGKGDVVVTYPLTTSCPGNAKETIGVKSLESEQDALHFNDIMIEPGKGVSSNTAITAPVDGSGKQFYYTLPMGDKNPAFIMSVSIDGDTELKTAVVPATLMQWKPNYVYTYIFKITEAGKKIEFYDVKIDPWKYGGSQNEEWKNW